MPGIALYLAKNGEAARAVAIWTLAKTVPLIGNSQWFAAVIGANIEPAAAGLPPKALNSAIRGGRALDLWQTAQQLLAEFSAG